MSRTQNLCPQQMLRGRANGETIVSATMCPQQCVLVCQGLNSTSGLPVPRYIFPLVLLAVEDSKTEKISFVNTLSYWFIFLFSFPLGTFSTLNQQLSNYLDYRLLKLFIFALNAALLFHGDDIHARIAFRRRVKDVENIVRKHTQFIKG